MRELHVVALSEDGRHLVLATRTGTASGEFRLALDDRLTAAVRGELAAPGHDAPPSISPREIQSRLRDGQAPEEIAAAAGVPLSRVERYAGPVLAELDRVITGARTAVVTRPRLGASALPLGAAVEVNLATVASLAEGSVRWSARRGDLGRWVVVVSWTARGRSRTAGWHYDPATREVSAVDGPSAVLGHVEDVVAASGPVRPGASTGVSRSTAGNARTASTTAASSKRSVRSAPAPTAPGRTPAAPTTGSRTTGPQPTGLRPTGSRPTGSRPTGSRAAPPAVSPPQRTAATTPTPTPVAPAARQRPSGAAPAPAGAAPATRAARPPAARTPAARTPAAVAEPAATTVRQRRAAVRRRTVPPLATPAPHLSSSQTPLDAPAPGPPVLRVVPAAAPEPVQDAPAAQDTDHRPDVQPQAAPARRAAGGRSWADVLMGGGPAPPPADPGRE